MNEKEFHQKSAEALSTLILNKRTAVKEILTESTKDRIELVRDYGTACFTILGASLTLLTVGPELIKTISLMYVSDLILLLALIACFIARAYYIADKEAGLIFEEAQFSNNLGRINEIHLAVTDEQRRQAVKVTRDTFETGTLSKSKTPKFFQLADKYIGIVILIGAGLFVSSLLLKVTL